MKYFDDENLNKKIYKFKSEVERLFYYYFGVFHLEDLSYSYKANSVPLDIYTNKNKLIIEIELPGISKDDIIIAVHNNILAIKWKSKPKINPTVNFFCIERRFGRFEKFVLLPITPSKQNIKANLSNGVLTINFEIGDFFIYPETLIPIS